MITTKEIAEISGGSVNHLSKILQRLVKQGFIRSIRGPAGGFINNCIPENVSLYDIYVNIEGEIVETVCPLNRSKCPFNGNCIYHGIIGKMSADLKKYMKEKKFSEFEVL